MVMNCVSIVIIACVAAVASVQYHANAFEVKDCTAGRESSAKLVGIDINSCPDQSGKACIFKRGEDATMSLRFEPAKVFHQANLSIYGKLGPFKAPFPMKGSRDACEKFGVNCPAVPGRAETLKITLPILEQYPPIPVVCRFELNDENKKPIVCIEFPVKLQ